MTQQANSSSQRILDYLVGRGGVVPKAIFGVMLVTSSSFGLVALWRTYMPPVVEGHSVSIDSIIVNQPPDWIISDIKQEALIAGSIPGTRFNDKNLTLKVAEAFRLHSWVERVVRVNKRYPDTIVVQLEYRRPVAMVEVNVNHQPGLFPVDVDGVLLPTADFTAEAAAQYPRICAVDTAPLGIPGSPWGDPRVHDAALLAAALTPYWDRLDLHRIIAMNSFASTRGRTHHHFRLMTRTGAQIIWGHAPGLEKVGESQADKKIARLLTVYEQNGLAALRPHEALDLRNAEKIDVATIPTEFR